MVAQDNKTKNNRLINEYAGLSVKLTAIKQEIIDNQKLDKQVREDLAVRIQAADARERNLKLREQKINQAEERIHANADLLNL